MRSVPNSITRCRIVHTVYNLDKIFKGCNELVLNKWNARNPECDYYEILNIANDNSMPNIVAYARYELTGFYHIPNPYKSYLISITTDKKTYVKRIKLLFKAIMRQD